MNDRNENIPHITTSNGGLNSMVDADKRQFVGEFIRFSEARFDKQREDLRAELCSGHDFDFYRMAEREDSRIGKEL